ncbi:carbohydrate ABC transporter permease [Ornithinimicrobium sp. Y1847]|uniref:carbohydrate ABC transporter permease n=1 Tax=unclassified Ornithinimicrobium TaxID=2615080 RepID=UPI003B682F15
MEYLLGADSSTQKLVVMVVAILLFVGVMALVLFVAELPKMPRWATTLVFVGPALLLLGFGLVYPAINTVIASFKTNNLQDWNGVNNYVAVFSNPALRQVLLNTLLWVLLVPVVASAIGLIYAVLVDRTRFEKLAKTLVFLPMAISMVGAGIIWKFVYDYKPTNRPQTGLANQLLVWMGFESQQFLLNWPANTFFLIAVMVWIQAGFAMTVLSAAIKAIPDDIIEAAKLDGASNMRMFRSVTVPSIRPALVVVMTTIAMSTLKVFDIVYSMTGGNFGTSIVANEFYIQTFRTGQRGIGATLAVLLFVMVIPLVIYNVRQMKLAEEQR